MKGRKEKFIYLIILFIFLLVITRSAFSKEPEAICPFCANAGIFRSGIYVISEGSVDVNNTYEESLAEGKFAFNYSIDASAENGKTVFDNSVSSVPFGGPGERLIRTGTIAGYDNQGNDGSLTGKESISSAICCPEGGAGMKAGVGYNLINGSIYTRSQTTSSNYMSEFSGSAAGVGTVSMGVMTANSSYGEDENENPVTTSSANYSQSVTVSGEFRAFSQTSSVSLFSKGCGLLW